MPDESNEPNDTPETATSVECNQSIEAGMSRREDVDYYLVNLDDRYRITFDDFQSEQSLKAYLYDANMETAYTGSTWLESAAYVKVEVDEDNIDFPSKDPTYTLTITCSPCTPGSYSYVDCHDGDLWQYDECDNPFQIEETCAPDETCMSDRCCEDEWTYSCWIDPVYFNWAVAHTNDCRTDGQWETHILCGDDQYCDAGNSSMVSGSCEDW